MNECVIFISKDSIVSEVFQQHSLGAWVFPAFYYLLGEDFSLIVFKCVSYLHSCYLSGAADSTNFYSTHLSFRVLDKLMLQDMQYVL